MDTNPAGDSVSSGKTSMGLDENVEGMLCYVLGWVTGVVFLVAEKSSEFVKFHAWQSILLFGSIMVLYWIIALILPWEIAAIISTILWIGSLILWVIMLIKAYQHEAFKLPIIGDFAHKQAYGS